MFSYRPILFLCGFLAAAAAHGTALPEPDAILHGNVIVQDGAYRTVLDSSEYRFEIEVNGVVRSAFAPDNDSGRYFVRFPNQVFSANSSTSSLDSTRFFVVHLATENRVECFETASSPITIPSHRAPVIEQDLVFSLGAGSLPDSDADGLPDGWETAYQTDSGDGLDETTQDAHLDFDKDGKTNLEEYLAGTDPTDATDRFEVVMMYDSTAKEPCLEFTGFRDRTYQIQAFGNTSTRQWQDVRQIQPGTDGTQIVPYPTVASDDDVCFYRVVIGR